MHVHGSARCTCTGPPDAHARVVPHLRQIAQQLAERVPLRAVGVGLIGALPAVRDRGDRAAVLAADGAREVEREAHEGLGLRRAQLVEAGHGRSRAAAVRRLVGP